MIMKFRGILVDMLCEITPDAHVDCVVHENGKKVQHMNVLRLLHSILKAALLYYKKFIVDVTKSSYKINPHDPCVANKYANKKQHTLTQYIDEVKASHVDSTMNTKFRIWYEKQYRSNELGHIKIT